MASSIEQRLIVQIPVNNNMVERAFDLLKTRCVYRNEDQFHVSTYTIPHLNMDTYIQTLLEQYKGADEEFRNHIARLKFTCEGQQFAKSFVIGRKSQFSVSVIASNRRKTNTNDKHKILIGTMTKIVEMSSSQVFITSFKPWHLLLRMIFPFAMSTILFGRILIDRELEGIIKQLNDEDNKKYLEVMALYLLGDKTK